MADQEAQMAMLKADQEKPLPYPAKTFTGKTIIITGSNTGLGLEAARHFVRCKASRVILAVRSEAKGEMAKADIEASTGVAGVVKVWLLDLLSYSSVKAFAQRAGRLDRLDVLIENAGVTMENVEIAEGTELTMTANVYSTFLLAVLLMPKLKETARKYGTNPTLNVVASTYGFTNPFEERNSGNILATIEAFSPSQAQMPSRYALSKLLQIFIMRELSLVFPFARTGVVLNYLHPGICRTGLDRNMSSDFGAGVSYLMQVFGRTAEDGSRNHFYAAVAGPESHGHFLSECEIADFKLPPYILAEDDGKKVQRKLWKELNEKLNAIDPGCVERAIKTGQDFGGVLSVGQL